MQLEIQKYLSQNPLSKIKEEYAINFKPSNKYSNLILFQYNQIESPMQEKICQEARGIILDANDNWKVVSMGFSKFFNFGELKAGKLDWNTAKVYTKHDGSLICLYRYNNEWLVSTTGHPDAAGNVHDFGFTFEELFWRVFREKGYNLPTNPEIFHGNMRYTYMFELETPYNRIVVDHKKNNLTLLGARDLVTLQELNPEIVGEYFGWDYVKSWDLINNTEEKQRSLILFLENLDPLKQEGFVVVDEKFTRVKMKSPKYIALHHALDSMSRKNMAEVILKGEIEECREIFSKFGNIFEELLEQYGLLKEEATKQYKKYEGIENQKDFALAVKDCPFKSLFFNARNKKISVEKAINILNSDSLLQYIDVYLPQIQKV